jgi:hypothetical protein
MIDPNILKSLIQYIIFQMEDKDCLLFKTRLIKFIYLIDYEYFRMHRKQITGIPWIRYQYGPYSSELVKFAKEHGIDIGDESSDFTTGNGIKNPSEIDEESIESLLPHELRTLTDRIIERWCDENLKILLDYVYCDTEPMENSVFGQPLDFSLVRKEPRYAGCAGYFAHPLGKLACKRLGALE